MGHHQPHHTGHPVAVQVQIGERGIPADRQIHLHAVEQGLEEVTGNRFLLDGATERLVQGWNRGSGIHPI